MVIGRSQLPEIAEHCFGLLQDIQYERLVYFVESNFDRQVLCLDYPS
jgi:hypothetical protein